MENFILTQKKIYINGRFLMRRLTGVDRFAIECLRALDELIDLDSSILHDFDFEILVPRNGETQCYFKNIPSRSTGSFGGFLWEQLDLPMTIDGNFLISLCNSAPIFVRQQLVVIHDAATKRVPTSYAWSFRLWYSIMIPLLLRRAESICTVSKFSRRELNDVFCKREHIAVFPEGVDHILRLKRSDSILEKFSLKNRPYVLAVSSLAPHKNFPLVIDALSLLKNVQFDFVIAGGQDARIFSGAGYSTDDNIKYVGYVTDGELKALYEDAACFIFPSVYEGYGLPPTEAMACGCPVLASFSASIPEVCGDAVMYFDANSPASLANLLNDFMARKDMSYVLCEKGRVRTQDMKWRNTATSLIKELRKVSNVV